MWRCVDLHGYWVTGRPTRSLLGPGKGLTSKKASFKKLVVLWKVEKRKRQGEERKDNFSDAKEGEGIDKS